MCLWLIKLIRCPSFILTKNSNLYLIEQPVVVYNLAVICVNTVIFFLVIHNNFKICQTPLHLGLCAYQLIPLVFSQKDTYGDELFYHGENKCLVCICC